MVLLIGERVAIQRIEASVGAPGKAMAL